MDQRTCTIDGCDKPHRARGLCGSHYQQLHQGTRHAKVTTACSVCGTPVEKVGSTGTKRRPVCSQRCRYYLTWERWPEDGKELVGPVPRRWEPRTQPLVKSRPSVRFTSGQCQQCGCWFLDYCEGSRRRPGRYCTERCKRRYRNKHDTHRGFWVTDQSRSAIYQRDQATCQLCFDPVDLNLNYSDEWSATLDHIVPRSLGGSNRSENLRLAHRWCNTVRGVHDIHGLFTIPT